MPSFQTNHKINHSADEMFALVADVEKYPQFVPYCQSLEIKGQQIQENGSTLIIADMTVAYKLIRETFTSKTTITPSDYSIISESTEGPFSHMLNCWSFNPVSESTCEVNFSIKYEFKSRMLNILMSRLFDRIFRKYSAAFESRADEIY